MRQIIIQDIKKTVCSYRLWITILVMIIAFIINVLYKNKGSDLTQIGVWNLFIIGNIKGNSIMCFLAPFIPNLVFMPAILDDIRIGAFGEINKKIGVKKNIYSRALSSLITGSSVFLITFLIILAVCFIISPINVSISYSPMGLFKEVYYFSVPLYVIVFILHSMLFGALYALLGMGIAIITKNDSMSMVLPGIIYNCARFAGTIFNNTIIYIIGYLFPFLTYEFGGIDLPLWKNILDLGIILMVSVVLIAVGYKKLIRSCGTLIKSEGVKI